MNLLTQEQNKNLILNNLDKYLIDGKGNFVNLEKDYDDSDYIIWKDNVKDYEEVKEKVAQEIVKDKEKRNKVFGKEISENLVELILSEKENWEIVYATFPDGDREPTKYKHRSTGEEIIVGYTGGFSFEQNYILLGELGYREKYLKDYDKWGHYEAKDWWIRRNYKKNKNQPPINPPPPVPAPPEEENKKFEEAKKRAEEEQRKKREPFQKKIAEIKAALNNKELPLTDRDLSPQYHDWEENINHSNDLQQVANFQTKILTDIQTHREEKKSTAKILKKFESVPNFNTKEKIDSLINPVKDNPDFLQKLKENNIENINSLIINKSPQEIIITVKRFQYDKDKDKQIRTYHHLNSNEVLTDEQINNYLYLEAIGQITSSTENPSKENDGLIIPLILGGGLLILLSVIIIRVRLKRR